MRGGKGSIFEGGVRVCAFASWPGHIPAGKVVDQPVHIIDWYPTLVNLAGGSLKQSLPPDGKDIWKVLVEGARSPHDALLLSGTAPGKAAVRVGDWKLLRGERDTMSAKQGKGAKGDKGEGYQLYNLANDLGEKINLAVSRPEKLEEMKGHLDRLLKNAFPFPKAVSSVNQNGGSED